MFNFKQVDLDFSFMMFCFSLLIFILMLFIFVGTLPYYDCSSSTAQIENFMELCYEKSETKFTCKDVAQELFCEPRNPLK